MFVNFFIHTGISVTVVDVLITGRWKWRFYLIARL